MGLIRNSKGTDVTAPFLANHHPEQVEKHLKRFRVGVLSPEDIKKRPARTVEYIEKIKQVQNDPSWFAFDPWYYAWRMFTYVVLLSLSVLCVVKGESTFVRVILGGSFLGAYLQQIAFIGHDIGHNGITHINWLDGLLGICLVANPAGGVSCGWWKATHNVHHLVTNSVEYDPDIQHMPVFAVSEKFFKGIYSMYHFRAFPLDLPSRYLLQYQHYLYYPIMALARWNLYLQTFIYLSNEKEYRRRGGKRRYLELAMLGVFWTWFITLCMQLPTFYEGLFFCLLSHAITGLLHVQITISHFPMPTIDGVPYAEEEFLDAQLKTCLDVSCSPMMDWFHGGLQFQAEHHLFPRIPRHNLRRLKEEFVVPLCEKHKEHIEYKEASFIEANKMVLRTLSGTADKLSLFILDGWNCNG